MGARLHCMGQAHGQEQAKQGRFQEFLEHRQNRLYEDEDKIHYKRSERALMGAARSASAARARIS